MRIRSALFSALLSIALLACIPAAQAQTFDRGEVHGVVYDQTHATVANAKVTIFNPSTGYQRTLDTGTAGAYAFPQLVPGVYQIKAEAAGFAPITVTSISVNIGASLAIDVTLPIKGQAESVSVTAEVTPVDTTTAGINQVLNQRAVESLPLAGRDYRDLAQLSSSAEVVPGLRGGIRMGGQQSDYAGLVIDGQDSFNNFFGEFFGSLETKNFTVPLDAVQEFQVVTNGFAPEFGRATGGLINVVTKSGTNQWHGSAHYNARAGSTTKDDALGIAPNIDLRQQFGGTVGFPIHKNTQFLFLATDIQRSHGPLVTQFCQPGADQATCISQLNTATGPGVFANCAPGTCGPGQVPLPTNVSAAQGVLPGACGTPAAGDSVLKDCYGVSNLGQLLGSSNQFNNFYTVLGHWDWQASSANHFSIRGYFTRNHTNGFNGAAGQNEIPNAFDDTENFINQGVSGVFALNTVLGRKVNEIRFSLQGETRKRHANSSAPLFTIADSATSVCPSGSPCLNVGAIASSGVGQRWYLPINNDNGKMEAQDNFEYTFGKHDIKFGGDVNTFVDRKDSFVGWGAGEYDYFSLADFNSNGFALFGEAAGLNGLAPCVLCAASTIHPAYQTDLGMYLQDKWQISPKLTLTYGLRWDGTWNPQPQTPLVGQQVLVGNGSGTHVAPVPQRIPNDFEQWGPRVGMAWNVRGGDHPTIVRAAWGLYYAQTPTLFLPVAGAGNLTHLLFSAGGGPAAGFPYILPNVTNLSAYQLCGTQYGCPSASSSGAYVDPGFRNPRVSNLTGSLEQNLAKDLTLTVTYAFVHSTRLRIGGYESEEAWNRNGTQCPAPNATDAVGRAILCGVLDPTIPGTTDLGSFGHGNYHSVVANVTKRFSRHFQVFGNYIWSQNKDNGASERDTDTYFGAQDPFNLNLDYGRNGLDIKHQFKAGGVYELPWGFQVSSSLIIHSGVPYPLYIGNDPNTGSALDLNGDGASDNGHSNDRPTFVDSHGKVRLLGRYPLSQPGFADWDLRLAKDTRITERYHAQLQADFFNLTNRGNLYSNPDTSASIDYFTLGNCVARPAPQMGYNCAPLTAPFTAANMTAGGPYSGLRKINQIAPGSTPFSFQAGIKFIF